MPGFSSSNPDPRDSALFARSAGEGLRAETSSREVAAVAAIQTDPDPASQGAAVYGETRGGGTALVGLQVNASATGAGLYAEARGAGNGIVARLNNPEGTGAALYAEHIGDKTAGFFKGDVIVTGDVSFPGMDCAEEFLVAGAEEAPPGTLMSIGPEGALVPSTMAYDRKLVGVVAGAGAFRPGIVMGKGRHPGQPSCAIALVGRASAWVDADFGAIEAGDLLTSSPRPGHAMKAADPARAFGAVIGKAMEPLAAGTGLVPILIALQ